MRKLSQLKLIPADSATDEGLQDECQRKSLMSSSIYSLHTLQCDTKTTIFLTGRMNTQCLHTTADINDETEVSQPHKDRGPPIHSNRRIKIVRLYSIGQET